MLDTEREKSSLIKQELDMIKDNREQMDKKFQQLQDRMYQVLFLGFCASYKNLSTINTFTTYSYINKKHSFLFISFVCYSCEITSNVTFFFGFPMHCCDIVTGGMHCQECKMILRNKIYFSNACQLLSVTGKYGFL